MKKKYIKPEIVRVKLDHEQAVIAVCSTSYADLSDSGVDYCQDGGCKSLKWSQGTGDIGAWS